MLVFVDESGDTGFKLGQGSSGQFTVVLVVFPDHRRAEALSDRIDQLRGELRLSADTEFHFKENSNSQREAFLQAAGQFPFLIFAVVVNKRGLAREGIGSGAEFYNAVCGLVFDSARSHLADTSVFLDSTGDLTFKRRLAAYLKRSVNDAENAAPRIKKVAMKPSHSDNLLQLADMVCGAISRAYDRGEKKTERFRRLIRHREVTVIEWP